ncbi:hypothetical protein CONPUDRAFT_84029 [Coniophora puteana RWD-64-598 SS2]|uniref:Uncharacterized protein n=1 Tax=Coniophora puteana (strain RWD-64-598) TaxID=741705 RepID=A0A5M3MEN1_CONPW|nr:uncharacterized protein CONPUDRAFT_84029 [Coniophora puteana RWD-64-598 SS2]EIW77507.1 hypothetical protein CONPUDRAFT_84029 [Coniophora puteana RWD-64-598 SS2]
MPPVACLAVDAPGGASHILRIDTRGKAPASTFALIRLESSSCASEGYLTEVSITNREWVKKNVTEVGDRGELEKVGCQEMGR